MPISFRWPNEPVSVRLRQIVLDFDGVIAGGTNRAYIEAYTAAIDAMGGGWTPAEIETGIWRHWGESPRRELAGVLGDGHPALEGALIHYLGHIEELLVARARPLAGALPALERLAASYTLYLVSGMGSAPLTRILAGFGIRNLFRGVISTSDADLPGRQKASGYHLRSLCRREGLVVHETLCVGDAGSDVSMARMCGIAFVAVLTGALDRKAADALGVTWVLPALADLPGFLDQQGWPLSG